MQTQTCTVVPANLGATPHPPDQIGQGIQLHYTALARGVLVVGWTDGHVEGHNPTDGTQLWLIRPSVGSIFPAMTTDGNMVFATIAGGAAIAIDPTNGQVLWNAGLSPLVTYGLLGPGSIDGDKVYVGGSKGLFAFWK